ncbi:MAG: F0F1 ATP synthase subunit alpha [SAR202 cluster bacterium]|nr:F0F1 ATP synthase subunit alpha [SAR202 cluster bacterium]
MGSKGEEISSVIKQKIVEFNKELSMVDSGVVVEVGDGIAQVHGLSGVGFNELVEFDGGAYGMALNLEEDGVGIVILGDPKGIKEGTEVRGTGRVVEVPVGEGLIGRVVNALGESIDGKGSVESSVSREIELVAPNVAIRKSVDTPLQTGIKSIDAMVPVGRGQRELIIGDRSTGKTSVAVDAIINQKSEDVVCIYVAIGQKAGKVAQTVGLLESHGAMDHTIVIAANASDPAPMQYLSPYSGCAMGEYFMHKGQDVLIVYDDLSKHAWAYRQMSLLLRRPPGREAYPGDVFYLHSRLLERSARLDDEHGGGSITALPIIETLAGDVSAYVPTNVISITDGQIYLEPELFNAGIRPAVNAGLSVSRVGSSAQTKAMKGVAGRLRLELAQYSELVTFAQFGTSDLDEATRNQLERGQRATEILKQVQNAPLTLEQQVTILFALTKGLMDDVEVSEIQNFERDFHVYMASNHSDLLNKIADSKDIGKDLESPLETAINDFKKSGFRND